MRDEASKEASWLIRPLLFSSHGSNFGNSQWEISCGSGKPIPHRALVEKSGDLDLYNFFDWLLALLKLRPSVRTGIETTSFKYLGYLSSGAQFIFSTRGSIFSDKHRVMTRSIQT